MTKYNFETRELVPYREDWNRGGKHIIMCGALWYIKEEDSIFLLDTEETRKRPNGRPYNRYRIAKGLPAALLAQGNELIQVDFDIKACYQAYFKEAEKRFPTKPSYHIPTIIEDWLFTLQHSLVVMHNISGYVDNYALMCIGLFLRAISNPYRTDSLEEKINHNYYYTCIFSGKTEAQFVFSQMPTIRKRTEAPLIYAHDMGKPMETTTLQADGFMAAIINLAIFYYWSRRWSEYNFTDIDIIERINKAYQKQESIIDIADLHKLSFDLPLEVEDICKAYMSAFEPIMRKVWKMKPEVQLECVEGDNIYTYIYAHEASSPERLYNSELYANLTNDQKRTLVSYGRRFMDWLVKTYPITMSSQHRIMQAIAKDMPPIQLTIQNDIRVTRAIDDEKPTKKQTKEPKAKEETTCPYINADALKEKGVYTVEQFQRMLRQSCEQEAKVLVDFLIKHESYGNLDFHGANMKAIYTTLRSKCFPTMRDYSYQNFAAAWKEALKPVA